MDVIPIEASPLHGDDVAGIFPVFRASGMRGPAELGDDDVLDRGETHLATEQHRPTTAAELFLVGGIAAQGEEVESERPINRLHDVTDGSARLERLSGAQPERRPEGPRKV